MILCLKAPKNRTLLLLHQNLIPLIPKFLQQILKLLLTKSHRIFLMIRQILSSRNRMMDLLLTWKQILRMEVRPLLGTAQLLMDFSTLRPE